jgi:hypothetical protein
VVKGARSSAAVSVSVQTTMDAVPSVTITSPDNVLRFTPRLALRLRSTVYPVPDGARCPLAREALRAAPRTDGRGVGSCSYRWSVTSDNLVLSADTCKTLTNGESLVLRENALVPGAVYTFTLNVTTE